MFRSTNPSIQSTKAGLQPARTLYVLMKADYPVLSCPVGYELLFQPEVVRIYISLLKESKTSAILEASAGAIQNLCAGRWTVSTF